MTNLADARAGMTHDRETFRKTRRSNMRQRIDFRHFALAPRTVCSFLAAELFNGALRYGLGLGQRRP